MGRYGEVLARYENYVDLDPAEKDHWGIPTLRFHYQFSDNEKKMCQDMVVAGREMLEASGIEGIGTDDQILTEGWSIHELGTARMGSDPKTSVLNQFQQSHDVKNLFVVDGSSHVSASCQNPTWTIMALGWRSCEYLAGEFMKGTLWPSRVAKCWKSPRPRWPRRCSRPPRGGRGRRGRHRRQPSRRSSSRRPNSRCSTSCRI